MQKFYAKAFYASIFQNIPHKHFSQALIKTACKNLCDKNHKTTKKYHTSKQQPQIQNKQLSQTIKSKKARKQIYNSFNLTLAYVAILLYSFLLPLWQTQNLAQNLYPD